MLKAHGVRGEMKIYIDSDEPELCVELDALYIGDEQARYAVRSMRAVSPACHFLCKLQGVDDRVASKTLQGSSLYVSSALLPALGGGENRHYHLLGMTLYDKGEKVGVVDKIKKIPGNPLLEVCNSKKSVWIPMQEALVERIDEKEKEIHMCLPEGLLDL